MSVKRTPLSSLDGTCRWNIHVDTEKRELVIESEVDGKEYVRVKVDCLFDGDGNLFEQDI